MEWYIFCNLTSTSFSDTNTVERGNWYLNFEDVDPSNIANLAKKIGYK